MLLQLGLERHTGREQSSELLPCPSDTHIPHTASEAVLTLAICLQHPQAPVRMQPFATASSARKEADEFAGPACSVQLVAAAAPCFAAASSPEHLPTAYAHSPQQRCQGPSHGQN